MPKKGNTVRGLKTVIVEPDQESYPDVTNIFGDVIPGDVIDVLLNQKLNVAFDATLIVLMPNAKEEHAENDPRGYKLYALRWANMVFQVRLYNDDPNGQKGKVELVGS